MGKRGPRKTPEVILEARGSSLPGRKDRTGVELDNNLPVIVTGERTVEAAAGAILENLEAVGWASEHHADPVLTLARLTVEVEEARVRMRSFMLDLTDPDSVKSYALLSRNYINLLDVYKRWCYDFGMTPAAAADMPAPRKKQPKKADEAVAEDEPVPLNERPL